MSCQVNYVSENFSDSCVLSEIYAEFFFNCYLFLLLYSEDVWMPYGSLSSQPGVSNVTQAALRLTTL